MKIVQELEDLIFGDLMIIEFKGISRENLLEDIYSIFHSHFFDGNVAGHFVDGESDHLIYDVDLCTQERKTASIRMIDFGERIVIRKNESVSRHPAFSVN